MTTATETKDFEYDFTGVEAASGLGGGGAIPAGIYTARATDVELGLSSGGYAQVSVQWQVIEGEYVGRKVRNWITFAPKSERFILAYMEALGLDRPAQIKAPVLAAYIAKEIGGKVVLLTVGQEPYKANDGTQKMGNRVGNIAPASGYNGGGEAETLSEDDAADIPF